MVGTASAPTPPEIVEAPIPDAMRSPADLLRALVAAAALLIVVLVQWRFGDSVVGFAADLFRGLDALPTSLTSTLAVALRVLALVFLLGGFIAALVRGRWRLLLSATLAAVAGALLFWLVDTVAPSAGPRVTEISDVVGPLTSRSFPTAGGLAAIAAIVAATAPWLGRSMRRGGWVLVWGLIVARFALAPLGFDTATAALSGWFAGSLVVVLLGGPSRRPTGAAIADGLARVGVPLARLEQASLDARGSTPYFAVGADGHKLFVKALGRDERSADVLFRMYRRVQPRDFGDEKPFSSLRRAVEHEALVALTARDLGVATPRVVAFTTADPNGFVLAYEAIDGRSLDRVAPEEVNDQVLGAIWAEIARLRAHRIAHRDLRLANVFLGADGTASIIDFGFSELAASDLLLATDLAELLASSALQVGAERAVASGVDAVGAEALATAIPRLQPSALSGATRTAYKQQAGALEDLRRRVSAS
jgi:tRNA A-37 threonylcarbamoyl transferase component Bud32